MSRVRRFGTVGITVADLNAVTGFFVGPGLEVEGVDFGEVLVVLNGVKTKCHMFVFRLAHSGRPFTGFTQGNPCGPASGPTGLSGSAGKPQERLRKGNPPLVTARCHARPAWRS